MILEKTCCKAGNMYEISIYFLTFHTVSIIIRQFLYPFHILWNKYGGVY